MKALFISNDPAILTEGSSVRVRMQEYARAIGELHIINRAPEPTVVPEGPLTIHGVPAAKLTGSKALANYANQLIVSQGIEVVSAQDPFEYGRIAALSVRGTAAKLHIQVHTDFLSPWFTRGGIFRSPQIAMPAKNRIRRTIADRVLPRADGIRVVSERVKASLMGRYGSRIPEPTVIPIAVGHALPDPVPLPPHPFPFALITVGRLEPEKRIEDILEALRLVREQYPAIGLIIVGEGREEVRLREIVASTGLSDRVVFAGARSDAWGLMQSAQGYIQASGYEGYGRTLIEAALARIPIITTDVGIVGEVLSGYEDVLSAPPGDPTNLAYHMIALLEDVGSKEMRIRSAEAKARAHVQQFQDLPRLIAEDLARTLDG